MSDVDARLASAASVRPAAWKDFLRQFVGGRSSLEPVHVSLAADLRALSTREVGAYQVFSVAPGNPGAGNHWCYTFTPLVPSRPLVLRVCFLETNMETATSAIGVRIGTATAKAASNVIFPIGDPNAALQGGWTADEVTNANVPLTLFNLFPTEDLEWFEAKAVYPEYVIEFAIQQDQVAELICLTQDDGFSLRLGYYTQPRV